MIIKRLRLCLHHLSLVLINNVLRLFARFNFLRRLRHAIRLALSNVGRAEIFLRFPHPVIRRTGTIL